MTERWSDKWQEVHYRETEEQLALFALKRQQHRDEWWEEFNRRQAGPQPETD